MPAEPLAPTHEEQQTARRVIAEIVDPLWKPGRPMAWSQRSENIIASALAAARATDQQRIAQLTAENTELLRIINQQADHED